SALLAHDAKHPLAGKLVTELLAHRQGGTWRTTQDSAFSLLAIDRYWRAQEREVPHFEAAVWLGEKPLFSQAFVERSTAAEVVSVDMKALRNAGTLDLVFQRKAAKGGAAAG